MSMLGTESALLGLAILIAWIYPSLGSSWLEAAEWRFSALARRRALAVVLVGATALALRLAVLPVEPIPEPIVHDEFGYLLAADTFAHGRLTNPTPPLWQHFETFSILMKPTYQCFAQPGQGMILALGKVVFGHPFWGVWLSCGLMCAAITWMLQGWVAAEWALLGGLLAVLRYGVFGYWADSYWGGAAAAIGGALLLGALPRIKESQRVHDAVIMGVGLAILANTRPFEGLVFSLPIAVVLIAWLLGKNSPTLKITLPRTMAPLALMLALTAAGMGYYLWRLTGSPIRTPYQIEQQTYAIAPYMLWQSVHQKPVYNNPVIEKMYTQEALAGYQASRTLAGLLLKAYLGWSFFLGPILLLPFFMLAFSLPKDFSWRDIETSTLFLLLVFAASLISCAVESFYNAHYSAPATGLFLLLVLMAIQRLRRWSPHGLFLSRAVPLICVIVLALRAGAEPLHIPVAPYYEFAWYQVASPSFGRATIKQQLERIPGNHLVIVHYDPNHEPFAEWVYNDADIARARIIWARELGSASDRQLVEFFPGRKIWWLRADEKPPTLQPFFR